jgi:hypothetical protein
MIELAAIPSGTKVTLVHDGFAGIGKPGWQKTVEGYERGAERHRLLEKLAAVVAVISKHLMVLRAAGLVTATRDGRNQLYRIDADGFVRALGPVAGEIRGVLVRVARSAASPGRVLGARPAMSKTSNEQDQQ